MIDTNKILNFFAKNGEFSVVILILFVLSMMVIPLPHELLDFIIAFNIGLTVVVLMVVIYMTSPLHLTSFPTILLMLAMLRIGITVSTSRLILLDGYAGKIITTFGEFVVGGNLIVGVIIFVIITIINFIVITKGSERVAEVAARFSLDAMPGKQMSIDSDLRAGNIDMTQANIKRKELGLESKLYGAMDGAMKFVKGDAIASIIDILINLVGGLIIGMVQRGMPFGDAIKTYSILTIGDGLVQQIPALIVSLTAGMMITRVSDEEDKGKGNLGQVLLQQIFSYPKALFAAAFLLGLFSLVPGMPSTVFIGLFFALIFIGLFISRKNKAIGSDGQSRKDFIAEEEKDKVEIQVPKWELVPLILNVANNLKDTTYIKQIKQALHNLQSELILDLGVEIPNIILRYSDKLEENTYQLLVYEIPATTGLIVPRNILVIQDAEMLIDSLDIKDAILNQVNFGAKNLGVWVDEKYRDSCNEYNLAYLNSDQFIGMHLQFILKQYISSFLGMQEVKNMCDKMTDYQDLIRELLRMLPLNKITEILQRLIAEDISLRNFKTILDAMLEWGQRERDIIIITEYVRKSLGRYISYKFSNGTYIIPAFILDSEFEDTVRDSIRVTDSGGYLAIDPDIQNSFIMKVKEMLKENNNLTVSPAIVTQMDIRRYVKSMLEKEMNFLPILSFQELGNLVEIHTLGVIEVL